MGKRFNVMDDVQTYLNSIPNFGMHGIKAANFSLDNVKAFCERIGNPQERLRAVHVAGTNGKGTTCQMLASVYQEAGYKVGLFTSPHLIRFNERIQVNACLIPDDAILEFFQRFEPHLQAVPLTYFEINTCLAFWYLEKENVDISIIETGLGGRLDATNILNPLISVITSVALDHMDILGNTIADIAREKGGIIKKQVPVVIGRLPDEAQNEIKKIASARHTVLIHSRQYLSKLTDNYFELIIDERSIKIERGNRKKIDAVNIATCWSVVQELGHIFPFSVKAFISGIENVDIRFPRHAHFEKLDDSLEWYFDGAHNIEAIDSLFEQLDMSPEKKEAILFFAMMKDKATPEVLRKFRRFSTVYYIDLGMERSAPCALVSNSVPLANCFDVTDEDIFSTLLQLKTELVIFTGSFYFYSQVKKWMASLIPSEY